MLEIMINMDSASEYKESEDTLGGYLVQKFCSLGFEVKEDIKNLYGNYIICKLNGKDANTLIIRHFNITLAKEYLREGHLR